MKLRELGFDPWFEAQAGPSRPSDQALARVTAVDRGAYRVRNESRELPAELAGKFRFQVASSVDLPCVGDWVTVQYHNADASALIHGVFPRKTFLRRKCAGESTQFQMIAANIDLALIVQSCHFDFNLRRLERYLVIATDGHVEPVILLTKTDLISAEQLEVTREAIRSSGVTARVLALSNVTGDGFDAFRQVLVPGITCCLLGSSGVGKTTLINRLIGREAYFTQSVSETGEGAHTTSRRQLIVLEQGGMLVDTPGMRELGLLDASEGVEQSFDDIHALSVDCRYSDCGHLQEPGCAVRVALASGALSEERYRSFLKLKKESEHHAMSYLDKRKKDKSFGRFVKTAKKYFKE